MAFCKKAVGLCGLFFYLSEMHWIFGSRTARSTQTDGVHVDPEYIKDHTSPDYEIKIELPEYDIRRLASARDPLAVVEAHRLNVCLRLAWLLGVRMCPECPRCNESGWGCQDLFGSNMRPTGGILGGVLAFEGGNEH